ncbi:hypothetical protein [endosymbiont GvMRE of Glomus versiforme]|uniref:hypothetical protein n=1 Tax=endosymbiont GvMRE of Glomus versiforme TaxID=2039283 RepID=UPI000EDBA2CF|nr:hypothetical protein [endosymbiont GvMRE of Glomus versiforme]RHZ37218.1 hypothetical protein GvMRE_I1g648 [endosymbiont GvMRE of Glomus versiforme]
MEHFTVCPHCRNKHLHYTFCQDLGTKNIFDIPWPEDGKISFALFKIKQVIDDGIGGRDIPDTEIFIPGFYKVKKVGQDFWTVLTEKEYQTFIAPSDYNADGDLFYVREKMLKIPIPEEVWKPHPHNLAHSTFQFYFLNNSLFTANLAHLRVNNEHQIQVDWKIRATPSGTYVFFRSGHIFFKWKIEVRQGIVNMSLVKVMIDGATKFMSGLQKAAGSFFGVDTSGTDEAKKEIAGNLVGKDRGKDFMKREKDNRNQELQTQRLFQSTSYLTSEAMLEPSVFYANTVKFPYNLFDYWLRNE